MPSTLESVKTNEELKDKFNIVSPEIIMINKDLKSNKVSEMIDDIENLEGIDFVLSFNKIKEF